MDIVDLESDQPRYWWTFDFFEDLNEKSDDDVFGGGIWKCNRIGEDYRLKDSYIAFDWIDDEDTRYPYRFKRSDDGLYCYSYDNDRCESGEAVRSDSETHTILTGRWTELGYGNGVFIAVFPKTSKHGQDQAEPQTRLDRLKRLMGLLVDDHLKFQEEHTLLLTAQVVLTDRIDRLAQTVSELPIVNKHTDDRLNALIAAVDNIVRKRPPQ